MATVELNTIEKKLERLIETKNDIKTAITNKGVTVEDSDTFNSYAEKIDSITIEPNLQSKEVSITSNGTTTISPDAEYDGLSGATITTNVQPNLQAKEVSLTSSAAATYTPDTGYNGLSSVKVTPATETRTYSVTSTSGGSISANSGKVGMTSVTITPKLQDKTANCTSTSAVTLKPDSGYCGLKSAKVTPVTETRTHNVTANGTTTVSVNSGKVGMTKVTVNTSVSPTLIPASRVQYCQEWGAGAVTLAQACVIPAKKNMLYVVTCICAASGAGAPTITWDSRTGCTYTYVSAASTASQINGTIGMKFYTVYYRVSNTSGSQQTTYIRTTMTENRGIVVSNIYV